MLNNRGIVENKTIKDYVCACAKSQGKISKMLLMYGEADNKKRQLQTLMNELQLLKEELLKEDEYLKTKISNIKKTGKFNTGSCYTDWVGWGTSLNVPTGGWPSVVGGGVVSANEDGSEKKPLPFGRTHIKRIPLRGEKIAFEDIYAKK